MHSSSCYVSRDGGGGEEQAWGVGGRVLLGWICSVDRSSWLVSLVFVSARLCLVLVLPRLDCFERRGGGEWVANTGQCLASTLPHIPQRGKNSPTARSWLICRSVVSPRQRSSFISARILFGLETQDSNGYVCARARCNLLLHGAPSSSLGKS